MIINYTKKILFWKHLGVYNICSDKTEYEYELGYVS